MELKKLVVFDLDHTLLKINCSYHFGSFLYSKNFFSVLALLKCLFAYSRYKWFNLPISDLHLKTFETIFKDRQQSEIESYVDIFLKKYFEKILNPFVLEKLLEEQKNGSIVMILSSSPDFLVGSIARLLSVNFWKATTYHIDSNGKLNSISEIMEGGNKATYLKQFKKEHATSSTIVYTDSIHDLPLLEIANVRIAVNPDSQLKSLCHQNDWEVMQEV